MEKEKFFIKMVMFMKEILMIKEYVEKEK